MNKKLSFKVKINSTYNFTFKEIHQLVKNTKHNLYLFSHCIIYKSYGRVSIFLQSETNKSFLSKHPGIFLGRNGNIYKGNLYCKKCIMFLKHLSNSNMMSDIICRKNSLKSSCLGRISNTTLEKHYWHFGEYIKLINRKCMNICRWICKYHMIRGRVGINWCFGFEFKRNLLGRNKGTFLLYVLEYVYNYIFTSVLYNSRLLIHLLHLNVPLPKHSVHSGEHL